MESSWSSTGIRPAPPQQATRHDQTVHKNVHDYAHNQQQHHQDHLNFSELVLLQAAMGRGDTSTSINPH